MQKNAKKREPWQIVVGTLSILCILALWIRKDVVTIYATLPKEQILPVLITTILVSLAKVALLTGVVLFARWLIFNWRSR